MLTELIANAIVTTSVVGSAMLFRHKLTKKKLDPSDTSMAWAWSGTLTDYGYRCPKCTHQKDNSKQPPICECEHYHTEHYHFKCSACKYTSIMRTADNS